jgi:hypothetical protein
MGNGYKWGVGALNNVHIWLHTAHQETNYWTWSISTTNSVPIANYKSIKPQNGPTLQEHVS